MSIVFFKKLKIIEIVVRMKEITDTIKYNSDIRIIPAIGISTTINVAISTRYTAIKNGFMV